MEGSKRVRKIVQKNCLIWSLRLRNESKRSIEGRAFQMWTSLQK